MGNMHIINKKCIKMQKRRIQRIEKDFVNILYTI